MEAVAADTLRPDWASAFEAEGAVGTFVLYDPATGQTQRHDAERAAERVTPASTSKVFNALVFLDQRVVADPDSLLAWDGEARWLDVWNQDHSLRSGVEVSAVWLFQRLANAVGPEGYADVYARYPYGNATMGEPLDQAWLNGTLRISADEQIAFLDGLRRGTLPFDAADQATVRGLMPALDEGVDADGRPWRIEAKTGWGVHDGQPGIGWLVGYLVRPQGDLVFAMHAVDAGAGAFDIGPARLRIARALLDAEGLL